MRSILAVVLLVVLASAVGVEPVMAQPDMSIPFVTTPWFVSAVPSHRAALIIVETNADHLATSDSEAFALSFLSAGNPLTGGPVFAPTIAQTSSRAIVAARTYTFQDFLAV